MHLERNAKGDKEKAYSLLDQALEINKKTCKEYGKDDN
jgi:hypothetical protein